MWYRQTFDESSGSRRRFRIWPLAVFAIFAAGYYLTHQQTVPITGRQQFVDMSLEQEQALGLQSYREVLAQSELVESGSALELVEKVGRRIAAVTENTSFDWRFAVIQSPEVNAFCLPGGKVAVYTGLLPVAEDADGLAVVMGHEIAHAIARHGAERVAQGKLLQLGQLAVGMSVSDMDQATRRSVLGAFGLGAQFGLMLPFSRNHESEADRIGLILMARACFDPRVAPAFWDRMNAARRGGRPPEFMSTHPGPERRAAALAEWIPEALKEREKFCKN
jgi:predicted Zn-dependent protease